MRDAIDKMVHDPVVEFVIIDYFLGFLGGHGFSPYYFNDPTGLIRLLVGAFITEEGANAQSRVLKSDGIDNQVILR